MLPLTRVNVCVGAKHGTNSTNRPMAWKSESKKGQQPRQLSATTSRHDDAAKHLVAGPTQGTNFSFYRCQGRLPPSVVKCELFRVPPSSLKWPPEAAALRFPPEPKCGLHMFFLETQQGSPSSGVALCWKVLSRTSPPPTVAASECWEVLLELQRTHVQKGESSVSFQMRLCLSDVREGC